MNMPPHKPVVGYAEMIRLLEQAGYDTKMTKPIKKVKSK